MAVYDLNASQLTALLDAQMSTTTANAVLAQLAAAEGMTSLGKLLVPTDVVANSGSFGPETDTFGNAPALLTPNAQVTSTSNVNQLYVTSAGGMVITTGDQPTNLHLTSPGGDTIVAGAYAKVHLGAGANTVIGGLTSSSMDTLNAGSGPDVMTVYHGTNLLRGGTGPDTLTGGDYRDTLQGNGASVLRAGSGWETLQGDSVPGANGQESLYGGSGLNMLTVYSGRNFIQGGTGFDSIVTGSGADTVYAGYGAHDTINLGSGQDSLRLGLGGPNYTAFVNATSGGTQIIRTGLTGSDTIHGGGAAATTVSTANASTSQVSAPSSVNIGGVGYTQIQFQNGQTLDVKGVTVQFSDHVSRTY